jgi:hypothetical protein
MSTNCISCRRFTVKDRITHERSDKAMRAQGMGRCQGDPNPARYYPAEGVRECNNHALLEPDLVEQRRAYLAKRMHPTDINT